MEAEEEGGHVGRDEGVAEVGERVVVGCGEGKGGREAVIPFLVGFCDVGGGLVECVSVDGVGEDLAQEEAAGKVDDDGEWGWKSGGDAERGAVEEDFGEEELDGELREGREEDVA